MPVGTEVHGATYDFLLSDDFVDSASDALVQVTQGLVTTGVGNHHGMVANTTYALRSLRVYAPRSCTTIRWCAS